MGNNILKVGGKAHEPINNNEHAEGTNESMLYLSHLQDKNKNVKKSSLLIENCCDCDILGYFQI